ncbi:hypothetical protein [Agrobacterium tumefaciens]|uniref:hypothetical protein n=1 Tax=Agrobacterium tumefaciens TaxID=358 RepID=UPI001574AA33|nr:hypothetical protein [Agrobacterium tumefaciens]
MTRHALDLTQCHFTKERGDLTLYGSWYGDRLRPCLALMPTNNKEFSIPLVIVVDDAWKWNPDDPDAQPELNAAQVNAFLHANQFDDANQFTRLRVISFIHDYLGDLLRIPPKKTERAVVADAYRTDENGKVHHSEISENV